MLQNQRSSFTQARANTPIFQMRLLLKAQNTQNATRSGVKLLSTVNLPNDANQHHNPHQLDHAQRAPRLLPAIQTMHHRRRTQRHPPRRRLLLEDLHHPSTHGTNWVLMITAFRPRSSCHSVNMDSSLCMSGRTWGMGVVGRRLRCTLRRRILCSI